MHHLLQSPVMADLFNSLKKQCLDQIGNNLKNIEKEIGTYNSADYQPSQYKGSTTSVTGSVAHMQSFSSGQKVAQMT
jgi:hypothetical protein